MGVDSVYEGSVVQINAANIGGIVSQNITTGTEVVGGPQGGELYSTLESIRSQQPEMTFTTRAVDTALAACGVAGTSLATDSLTMLAKKRTKGGSYEAGASHRTFSADLGLLVPTALEASFGEDATISYRAVPLSDGATAPVAEADSQALIESSVHDEAFSLYSVQVGGVTLDQATNFSIDFGFDIERVAGATGDLEEMVWPTFASIRGIAPRITISGNDIEWLKSTNIPFAGKEGTQENCIVYLAKRKDKGTFDTLVTTNHIKITFAAIAYVDTAFSASGKEVATATVEAVCQHDGTNTPVKITTDSAIT